MPFLSMILTPAEHILASDRKTARWLNLAEARVFYRCVGAVILAFGLTMLVFTLFSSSPG